VIDGIPAWFFQTGPPNWVFLVALLTSPSKWAKQAKRVMKKPFGGGSDD
jgi:hypothetical protein